MAEPSTGYDLFTLTNPPGALTDPVLELCLNNISDESKAVWDTNLNGYGRIYKEDDTELACDWILVDASKTSLKNKVKFKWSGVLAASGTQKVKVYPPNTGNIQYLITDTYGKNAVYTGYIASYPLLEENAGTTEERSGNGYDLTVSGAVLQSGGGYLFDGADDYLAEGESRIPTTAFHNGFSICLSIYQNGFDESSASRLIEKATSGLNGFNVLTYYKDRIWTTINNSTSAVSANGSLTLDTWYHIVATISNASLATNYINGLVSGTPTTISPLNQITSTNPLTIGNRSGLTDRTFSGIIKKVEILIGDITANCVSYRNSQMSDNAAFWGTPVYNPPITSNEITIDLQSKFINIINVSQYIDAGQNFIVQNELENINISKIQLNTAGYVNIVGVGYSDNESKRIYLSAGKWHNIGGIHKILSNGTETGLGIHVKF